MKKEIPKILYGKDNELGIEVLNFNELYDKLQQSTDQDPFTFHKLQFNLILIVAEKHYQHFVDFEPYDLKEGSILFIAEGQVQHFTDKLLEAKGVAIIFDDSYFEKSYYYSGKTTFHRLFNYHIEKPTIHREEMRDDDFVELGTKLYTEFAFPDSRTRTNILYSLLKILLLKAERIKEVQAGGKMNTKSLEIFTNFKSLLETEYMISRSSRYYANKLLISYKSLNDVVKVTTTKTVKTFINDFVTIEIKRYLKSSSLCVKEISYKTGFEESTNLVTFFKKNTGTTPLQFRNQE